MGFVKAQLIKNSEIINYYLVEGMSKYNPLNILMLQVGYMFSMYQLFLMIISHILESGDPLPMHIRKSRNPRII